MILKRVKRTARGTRSPSWRTWCLYSRPDPRRQPTARCAH
jgi:hypothetical protein